MNNTNMRRLQSNRKLVPINKFFIHISTLLQTHPCLGCGISNKTENAQWHFLMKPIYQFVTSIGLCGQD